MPCIKKVSNIKTTSQTHKLALKAVFFLETPETLGVPRFDEAKTFLKAGDLTLPIKLELEVEGVEMENLSTSSFHSVLLDYLNKIGGPPMLLDSLKPADEVEEAESVNRKAEPLLF